MKNIVFILLFPFLLFLSNCTSKEEKIDKFMKEGIENIRSSDNKKAIEDFTNVISIQADNYEAYYYRANAKFNLKMAKEALLDYNKAVEIKPDYADAFYNRAFCKQFLNDKDGACNDWKKVDSLGKPNIKDLLHICR